MSETLDAYVRRALRVKGLTLNEVAQRAGGEISRGYISEISRGNYTSLTVRKLQALARGLDVPEDELFAIARGAQYDRLDFAESRFAVLFARYCELPAEDQREVAIIIDAVAREIDRRREQSFNPGTARWAATAAVRLEAIFGREMSRQ